jgi:hypothetical protein
MQTKSILSVSSSSQHRSLASLIKPNPRFGIGTINVKDIPPPTAEDLQPEEVGKVSKEYRQEFSRLKRLARAIGVQKVVVTPSSPSNLDAVYFSSGCEAASSSAQGWDLTKEEINLLNKKEGGVILVFYLADPFCRHFAHEIGHHIYDLAEITKEEQSTPVTETMKGFFPHDESLHDRDEICAESFSEFLTVPALRTSIKRHCDSVLRRVRVHNPNAAKLIESYRKMALL